MANVELLPGQVNSLQSGNTYWLKVSPLGGVCAQVISVSSLSFNVKRSNDYSNLSDCPYSVNEVSATLGDACVPSALDVVTISAGTLHWIAFQVTAGSGTLVPTLGRSSTFV